MLTFVEIAKSREYEAAVSSEGTFTDPDIQGPRFVSVNISGGDKVLYWVNYFD